MQPGGVCCSLRRALLLTACLAAFGMSLRLTEVLPHFFFHAHFLSSRLTLGNIFGPLKHGIFALRCLSYFPFNFIKLITGIGPFDVIFVLVPFLHCLSILLSSISD